MSNYYLAGKNSQDPIKDLHSNTTDNEFVVNGINFESSENLPETSLVVLPLPSPYGRLMNAKISCFGVNYSSSVSVVLPAPEHPEGVQATADCYLGLTQSSIAISGGSNHTIGDFYRISVSGVADGPNVQSVFLTVNDLGASGEIISWELSGDGCGFSDDPIVSNLIVSGHEDAVPATISLIPGQFSIVKINITNSGSGYKIWDENNALLERMATTANAGDGVAFICSIDQLDTIIPPPIEFGPFVEEPIVVTKSKRSRDFSISDMFENYDPIENARQTLLNSTIIPSLFTHDADGFDVMSLSVTNQVKILAGPTEVCIPKKKRKKEGVSTGQLVTAVVGIGGASLAGLYVLSRWWESKNQAAKQARNALLSNTVNAVKTAEKLDAGTIAIKARQWANMVVTALSEAPIDNNLPVEPGSFKIVFNGGPLSADTLIKNVKALFLNIDQHTQRSSWTAEIKQIATTIQNNAFHTVSNWGRSPNQGFGVSTIMEAIAAANKKLGIEKLKDPIVEEGIKILKDHILKYFDQLIGQSFMGYFPIVDGKLTIPTPPPSSAIVLTQSERFLAVNAGETLLDNIKNKLWTVVKQRADDFLTTLAEAAKPDTCVFNVPNKSPAAIAAEEAIERVKNTYQHAIDASKGGTKIAPAVCKVTAGWLGWLGIGAVGVQMMFSEDLLQAAETAYVFLADDENMMPIPSSSRTQAACDHAARRNAVRTAWLAQLIERRLDVLHDRMSPADYQNWYHISKPREYDTTFLGTYYGTRELHDQESSLLLDEIAKSVELIKLSSRMKEVQKMWNVMQEDLKRIQEAEEAGQEAVCLNICSPTDVAIAMATAKAKIDGYNQQLLGRQEAVRGSDSWLAAFGSVTHGLMIEDPNDPLRSVLFLLMMLMVLML